MLNSKARNLAEVNLREILSDKQITSEMLIKKEKKKECSYGEISWESSEHPMMHMTDDILKS